MSAHGQRGVVDHPNEFDEVEKSGNNLAVELGLESTRTNSSHGRSLSVQELVPRLARMHAEINGEAV